MRPGGGSINPAPSPRQLSSGRLSGLAKTVTVRIDPWGAPRIQAETPADLYFAHGYLHARHRFFQMDVNRRTAAGRLAALLGPDALPLDRFYRRLNFARAAAGSLALVSGPAREAADAYAAGVNRALDDGFVPPEHQWLGATPEPWTPADSVLALSALFWALNTTWMLKWAVAQAGDDALARELLAGSVPDAPSILGGWAPSSGGGGVGSNNWVVSGAHTASGHPLLANDPHLMAALPGFWYNLTLQGPDVDVSGFTIPGAPGVIIGQNAHLAWGVTNVDADVQDVYRLIPAPDGLTFPTPDGPARLMRREERIEVRGAAPERLTCWDTPYGPVLYAPADGEHVAVSWLGFEPTPAAEAIWRLNRAANWTAFREALQFWWGPAMHYVYADRDGHIGYVLAGKVRASDPRNWLKVWDAARRTPPPAAWIPEDRRPVVLDPPSGMIVTANNPPVDASWDPPLRGRFAQGTRARRIAARLAADAPHTVAGFGRIQVDDYAEPLHRLASNLAGHPAISAAWRPWLARFDGRLTTTAVAPTLLYLFAERALPPATQAVLARPLFEGETAPPNPRGGTATLWSLVGERLVLWLDRHWAEVDIARTADAAERAGREAFGPDHAEWQWGRAHQLTLAHPLAGAPGLAELLSRANIPLPGDVLTVHQASFPLDPSLPWPRPVTILPSMRAVFDVCDPAASVAVNLPGQDGHPLSPWFDAQLASYLHQDLLPLRPDGNDLTTMTWTPPDAARPGPEDTGGQQP
jgi:penicillin amidase